MPQVKLSKVRLSFNDLFEAKSYKESAPNYGAKFLIEPGSANDKAIRAAVKEAAVEMFGKKADAMLEKHKTNNMKNCYLSGDLDNQDEHDGFMILSSKRKESKGQPTVLDEQRMHIVGPGKRPTKEQEEKQNFVLFDGKPYSGCYVNAIVDIYTMKGDYEGIRCGLGGVQFAKDGDAFAGGKTPRVDDFEDITEGADASDLE